MLFKGYPGERNLRWRADGVGVLLCASLSDRQLLGSSPGAQTLELVHPVRERRSPDEALAEVGGVNVHVGSAIDGSDRQRLERVCRYMTRPPVCQERPELSSAGLSWFVSNAPGVAERTRSF